MERDTVGDLRGCTLATPAFFSLLARVDVNEGIRNSLLNRGGCFCWKKMLIGEVPVNTRHRFPKILL